MLGLPNQGQQEEFQLLAGKTLDYITAVIFFKDSNLEENSQILQIYKRKDQYLNKRPNLWQTFIFSIRKFNKKPFDTSKNVFQIIFRLIFTPYFQKGTTSEIQAQKECPNQAGDHKDLVDQQTIVHTKIKSKSGQILGKVLEVINDKPHQYLIGWIRENLKEIKDSQIPAISKQQIGALQYQLKTTSSLLTLEYISNIYWHLVVLFNRQIVFQFDKKLVYQILIKYQSLHPLQVNKPQFEIQKSVSKYLKRKFHLSSAFTYIQLEKVYPVKLAKLIVKAFCYVDLQKQSHDLKFYMHSLHKAAEKHKNILIADMIRSKCFVCEAQRYSSNSIHKIRIYQCLSRKLLNSLTSPNEKIYSSTAENLGQNQQKFYFDCQDQEEFE